MSRYTALVPTGRRSGRAAAVLTAAGAAVALATPALAAPGWAITSSVDPSAQAVPFSNVLNAVGARTSTDVWAVGNYLGPNEDDGQVMLTERWDGRAWSQVPTPNTVGADEKLLAVSPAAANDVWAVGSTNRTGFAHTDPLAAHWDGTRWAIVPTPVTTGSTRSILSGVANLGGGNVWAVGRSAGNRALVEHWNGSAWTIVPTPDPVPPAGSTLSGSALTGISARAANDIWAVGNFATAQGTTRNGFTLTMHWNGSVWRIVRSPNPATPSPVNGVSQTLNGVAAISATDAWAVGNTIDTVTGSFQPDKPIAMHWNGTAWLIVPFPGAKTRTVLASVSASSPTSVWAAGRVGDGTLILHWNGTSLTQEASPDGGGVQTLLNGISAVPGSATEVWAAGINLPTGGGYHTFVVHHL